MPFTKRLVILFSLLFYAIGFSQIVDNPEKDAQLKEKINTILTTSKIKVENRNYYMATNDLEKALTYAEDIKDEKLLGIINSKIGKLKFITEEYKDAVAKMDAALFYLRKLDDKKNLAEAYKTYGNIRLSKGEYEIALNYFNQAQELFRSENLVKNYVETLLNQGLTYIQLNDYVSAEEKLNKTVKLADRNNYAKILSSALMHLGKVESALENNEKGIRLVNKGYDMAKNQKFTHVENQGLLILSDLYEKDGDLQQSLSYLKQYFILSDSLIKQKKIYLSPEKKDQIYNSKEIAYKEENLNQSEKIMVTKVTTILSIALITILSLLTLSLYKNNNIRLKSNNILHKKNDELTQANEKAELAIKTKANFLSTVTHELRTPLYAVTGLTNMLLDESPKPEQVQHLKSLKFSGEYLLQFINDILQINKIEANKVDIEPEIFNLKKKMSNVIAALSNQALDNGTHIHFEYDPDLPENYNADQLKISQILINLIGNAIKFTKDGDIWVRTKKLKKDNDTYTVLFEVEDNGIGISPEKQDEMFESFSQGSIQINRKYGGTGLGLSIVKGLLGILKGKIYLKSALGKGSTFFFEVPMEYTSEKADREKVDYFKDMTAEQLSGIKILVVEDNKINQMITKKILTKMNLPCEVVDNGEAAVENVKNKTYDVVLMDIHMPGISGIEATKQIRKFNTDLTIFALTAVTIEDKMQEFEDAGFDDVISKPFKQEEFEKKMYKGLNKSFKQAL